MRLASIILILLLIEVTAFTQLNFHCGRDVSENEYMKRAWFPYQLVDSLRFNKASEFIIANLAIKPCKFISSEESCYRSLANDKLESKELYDEFNLDETVSYEEHCKRYYDSKRYWDSCVIAEHKYANAMDMAVWIQNTSSDTIIFPIQGGSLIGIIEALDKEKNWKPIKYWWFSWCGNSYNNFILPPAHSVQIGVNNKLGDIATLMRLKIHGRDTIYVSNTFEGTVRENDFILSEEIKQEMLKDKYRYSFLDSVRYGLTDESEYEIILYVEEED